MSDRPIAFAGDGFEIVAHESAPAQYPEESVAAAGADTRPNDVVQPHHQSIVRVRGLRECNREAVDELVADFADLPFRLGDERRKGHGSGMGMLQNCPYAGPAARSRWFGIGIGEPIRGLWLSQAPAGAGSGRVSNQEQRAELRRFLKDRRARVDPNDVGIAATGRRRVRGLRREEVANLAGIGVSWYTALESGEAEGVSESTVLAVAAALRLSDSERNYLLTLAGRLPVPDEIDEPSRLLRETMHALKLPAYIVTASWEVLDCNEAFRRVWAIDPNEVPFNAVERLFMAAKARELHGEQFITNIAPVVAMLRSAVGRRPHLANLRRLREKLMAEKDVRELWEAYEISDPLVPNTCTIDSPIGSFTYEALTLANPGETTGIVVQIPDQAGKDLLARTAGG